MTASPTPPSAPDDVVMIDRVDVASLRGCFIQMLDAIKTGNIDSPWLSGDPEVGIPAHKWHEEWEFYAKDMLSILETALKGKE